MADELNRVSEQTGLDLGMVQKGFGALLAFLKEKLGDDTTAKIRDAIPNAGELLSKFQSAGPEASASSGGILGSVSGMAGKLLGGKAEDASDLVQKFTGAGFSMEQLQRFLPKALEFLQSKLPPEVYSRVMEQLPNIPGLNLPDATKTT